MTSMTVACDWARYLSHRVGRSVVVVLAVFGCAYADAARADPPEYLAGEIIVGVRDGVDPASVTSAVGVSAGRAARVVPERLAIDEVLRAGLPRDGRGGVIIGGRSYGSVDEVPTSVLFEAAYEAMPSRAKALYRAYRVSLPAGADVDAAVRALEADPGVEFAEPNYLSYTSLVPSDARYPEQWSHAITSAESGWDIETGDPSIVIAVVDSGVDYGHPDLAANVWTSPSGDPGFDFVDIDTKAYKQSGFTLVSGEDYKDRDADPSDRNGHGTHVAGIAAAVSDNGIGVAGVCHGCRIMPARAGFAIEFDGDIFGVLESADIAAAITWAADNGAHVINMSFGSSSRSQAIENALEYARFEKGVVPVAAAGNSGSELRRWPAGLDFVLAVSATGIDDDRAFYSTYGLWTDVAAPGGSSPTGALILSTVPPGAVRGDPSGYTSLQGTSMASPYVAGLVGLLLSRFPTLDPDEIRLILRSTADPPASSEILGYGRVNVPRAVGIGGPTSAVAAIASPEAGDGLFDDPVSIVGTASGTGYVLEIADHPHSLSWTVIATGTSVVDGVLGVLDPTTLATGQDYYLRLTVSDTYDVVDLVPVYAGARHSIEQKAGAATLVDLDGDGAQEILVAGHDSTVTDTDLEQLWAWHDDGSAVAGFPIALQGARWPEAPAPAVGDLDDDGSLEIVHTGQDGIAVFNHDGTPFSSWPESTYTRSPATLADLDGDGDLEILVPSGWEGETFDTRELSAWHHDRTPVAGFPVPFEHAASPAVGDLDQDGTPEIVVIDEKFAFEPYEIHVLRADGSPYPGWPQSLPDQSRWNLYGPRPPMLVDLSGDGDLEIVAAMGRAITAWEHDGTLLPGFPLPEGASTPAVASDLDGDGDLEIVYAHDERLGFPGGFLMQAYHHDGTPVAGWPVVASTESRGPVGAGIVTGDIDGDGDLEVVAKIWPGVLAWHHDGSPVAGFPIEMPPNEALGVFFPLAFPALGDVDGDGALELVTPNNFGHIHTFDLAGPYDPRSLPWPTFQVDLANSGTLPSTCGNAEIGPGEECDDGGESAACDRDCTFAVCGDAVRNATAGEDCDGLAGADAGCCDAACMFESPGTLCDDADVCTQLDVCDGGLCAGRSEPAALCRSPAKVGGMSLALSDRTPDRKDALKWKGKMGDTSGLADFGSPLTSTSYTLCVYDRSAAPARIVMRKTILPGGLCRGKPCWKELGAKGFRYKNRDEDDPLDIDKLQLKLSKPGTASIAVNGKGENLAPPPLPMVPPVTVQLHNDDNGLCWSAEFEAAISRNDGERFKAKSD